MNKYLELVNELNDARKLFETDDQMVEYIDKNMEEEKKELMAEYKKITNSLTYDEKSLIHELFRKFGIIKKI